MSKFPTRRLVAATVLAATLAVFTLPAAAAPIGAWSYGTWELPTFLSWFDTLWSGMFGGEREASGDTGPVSIHEQIRGDAEPDGLMNTSIVTTDGEETTPRASGNVW